MSEPTITHAAATHPTLTHEGWLPDQWYPLIESRRLHRRPLGVQRLGERIALWRDASGAAIAMRDRCPHRGVALSRGSVKGNRIACPYHGFQFDSSGACQLMPCEGEQAKIPAGMTVDTYPVREQHGLVWIYWGEQAEELPEIPWFDEISGRRGGASTSKSWPINFVRTIESNFDIHHTPIVHGAVMPGLGSRLDPYHVEVNGSHIATRGELRKPGADSGLAFRMEFKMPCVTLIELTPKVVFVVADCPIDQHSTWRWARYYVDYLPVPGIHQALSWLFLQVDWVIYQFPQDLKVMETQEPNLPDRHVDRLVRADGGTTAYLKLRRQLWAEAEARRDAGGSLPLRHVS